MPPQDFRWMTAEEWDTSDYIWLMAHNADQKTGNKRKLNLFGVACCRRPRPRPADVRGARLLGDADPGRRPPGRGLRERRHPRPLPRPERRPRPRLLGSRSGAGQELTVRSPQEENAMTIDVPPTGSP